MNGRIALPGVLVNAALIVFAFTTIFPMIWVVYNSLKTTAEFGQSIFALPASPNLDAYREIVAEGSVFPALWNSLFYAGVSTVLIVLLSYVVAYALARFEFRAGRSSSRSSSWGFCCRSPRCWCPSSCSIARSASSTRSIRC